MGKQNPQLKINNGPQFCKPNSLFDDCRMRDYDDLLAWHPTAFTNGDGIKTTGGGVDMGVGEVETGRMKSPECPCSGGGAGDGTSKC